jgi:hypothetical protein
VNRSKGAPTTPRDSPKIAYEKILMFDKGCQGLRSALKPIGAKIVEFKLNNPGGAIVILGGFS